MRNVNVRIIGSMYVANLHQAATLFGEQHGCMPITKRFPSRRPLALDILKRQYNALMAGNLLAFQADFIKRTGVGKTFEVKVLGKVGYFTNDPQNIEAIVSTKFEGKIQ